MKKIIVLTAMLFTLIAVPVMADVEGISGVKLDMPDLIRLNQDWTIGVEAGKDLYNILPDDQSAWVEDDRGYFGYAKVTCKWTLLDFSSK